jgi:hypothetical protein
MKTIILILLLLASSQAQAIEVSQCLSFVTGWTIPGHEMPFHFHDFEHHHGGFVPHGKPDCQPVPIPGTYFLLGSAIAGLGLFVRRKA